MLNDEGAMILPEEQIMLSEEDRKAFIEALLNPPEPSEGLRKKFQEFRSKNSDLNLKARFKSLLEQLQGIPAVEIEEPLNLAVIFVELYLVCKEMESMYWSEVVPTEIPKLAKRQEKHYRKSLKDIQRMIPTALELLKEEEFEKDAGAGILSELLHAIAAAQQIKTYRQILEQQGGVD